MRNMSADEMRASWPRILANLQETFKRDNKSELASIEQKASVYLANFLFQFIEISAQLSELNVSARSIAERLDGNIKITMREYDDSDHCQECGVDFLPDKTRAHLSDTGEISEGHVDISKPITQFFWNRIPEENCIDKHNSQIGDVYRIGFGIGRLCR